jgi:hypothetical protein
LEGAVVDEGGEDGEGRRGDFVDDYTYLSALDLRMEDGTHDRGKTRLRPTVSHQSTWYDR